MNHKFYLKISLIVSLILFSISGCIKRPWPVDYQTAEGYVIGRETCSSDTLLEYWLVDFNLRPNAPQIGDTITLNGKTFTNALKIRGLFEEFKVMDAHLFFEYKVISEKKIKTSNCKVAPVETFELRELFILRQGQAHDVKLPGIQGALSTPLHKLSLPAICFLSVVHS